LERKMNQPTSLQSLILQPCHPTPEVAHGRSYSLPAHSGLGQDDGSSDDSLGIFEYLRILKRRRGTLAFAALLGTLAVVGMTLPQSPVYRARTTLEIQNVNSDFLNSRQINPVTGEDSPLTVLTDVQTQMKILESEHLAERVADRLKADHKLGSALSRRGPLGSLLGWLHLSNKKPEYSDAADYTLRKRIMQNLTIRQLGETRMIEAVYTSSDPQFAADFLNTLASEYIQSNVEARWKMSERTGEWLAAQLEGMRKKLQQSEVSLHEYAQRSGLLFAAPLLGNSSEKTNVSEDKLRQLQQELSRAQADRALAQSRYEIAKSAAPESLGDVLNDQSLRGLQSKLTDLRRQEAELSTIYTPKNENVRMVEAQIKPLEAEFEAERAAIIGRIYNDYAAALRREKLLSGDYAAQSEVVTDQAGKSIQYNILKREVDSNRQIYESVLQQVKEASVASAIRASNIRVVDPAQKPPEPYSPNLILNSALGLFGGVFFGAVFALVQERRDRSLQTPGETPFWTKLPELGVIPSAKLESRTKKHIPEAALPGIESAESRAGLRQAGERVPLKMELIAWTRKSGITAEAFRTILASVLFTGENGSRPKVLAFTSDGPADGKTTVVSNLALVAAEVRHRILIIDADLRRPRMHELFGVSNECGLGDLLCANALEESGLDRLIRETYIPNVHLLTSGPALACASHLLHSSHLPLLLARLKKEFDMVLIDTPPVLQVTDARIIGRLSDAVVLVTRAGRTTRDAVMVVRQRFLEDGTRVLGTILNDWNPDYSPEGYHGYYIGANSGSKWKSFSRPFKQSND
jgi:polysaccharide biosynthesis transport protein